MSRYLAIDTATEWGSVALGEPGAPDAEMFMQRRRHAADLIPTIEELLRRGGTTYEELGGLVVADGPGSFTGLRIGFATAKGILHEHGHLDLKTTPSLLAAAWGVRRRTSGCIAPLYDALRGQVFGAVYGVERDRIVTHVAPTLGTVTQLTAASAVIPSLAVGDGAAVHGVEVKRWTNRAPIGPPEGTPRASSLIELLSVPGATAAVPDPRSFEPRYGRAAEAQVRWERQHGRKLRL